MFAIENVTPDIVNLESEEADISFLTDLFEGHFNQLGTDLSHAPSSLAAHPDQLAETLGGAALIGGGILGLGALGADAGIAGAGAADLGATGALDLGAGADLAAAGDVAAGAADFAPGVAVGFDAAGNAIGDTALFGGDVLAADAASAFAPDVLSADAGSLNSFFSNPEMATSGIDTSAGITDTTGALDTSTGATPAGTAATAPSATPGGFAPTDAELSGGVTGTAPATAAAPSGGTAGGTGGLTSGLGSVMASPWTKLGLGLAPLALTLARGEPSLTPAGRQAQANANQLSQFGNQQLAQAQAGQLNPGQLASLNQMRQDLTNQWKQTFFNMGVQNPEKDTRFVQAMADVDQKITAKTGEFIQQMIQNGLAASGAASGTLIQVANQQMAQDQAFTNNLISATKALGTTVGGGQTITLKAA